MPLYGLYTQKQGKKGGQYLYRFKILLCGLLLSENLDSGYCYSIFPFSFFLFMSLAVLNRQFYLTRTTCML